jgi:hypothetical protein
VNAPSSLIHPSERVVLTPKEFASLFGRNDHWAYRQISAGKVKTISKLGRIMIPRSEVERLSQQLGNSSKTSAAHSSRVERHRA